MVGLQALLRLMSYHGIGSKPCAFREKNSLADLVLNHVLARQRAEMGLVGACYGDWVIEELKKLEINFLAMFFNLFHLF